jgi:hypothetical protein
MSTTTETISIADLLGPWSEPAWDSGLIERCRNAWDKPLRDLSREELATLLRQRIAVVQLLPIAEKKLKTGVDDGTEMFEGELKAAVDYANSAT